MKKMHWFRSLLCLLSAVFVLSAFAGCKGDKPNSGTNEESRDTNGANTGDGNQYDAEGYLKDSIPSNLKYDDGIKILGWNLRWRTPTNKRLTARSGAETSPRRSA